MQRRKADGVFASLEHDVREDTRAARPIGAFTQRDTGESDPVRSEQGLTDRGPARARQERSGFNFDAGQQQIIEDEVKLKAAEIADVIDADLQNDEVAGRHGLRYRQHANRHARRRAAQLRHRRRRNGRRRCHGRGRRACRRGRGSCGRRYRRAGGRRGSRGAGPTTANGGAAALRPRRDARAQRFAQVDARKVQGAKAIA